MIKKCFGLLLLLIGFVSPQCQDTLLYDFLDKSIRFQSTSIDSAIYYGLKAYGVLNDDTRTEDRLKVLVVLGNDYQLSKNIGESDKYFGRALALAEKTQNRGVLGDVYNGMGGNYFAQEKSNLALEYYIKAANYYQSSAEFHLSNSTEIDSASITNARRKLAASYNNIGLVLADVNRNEESIPYYKKAIALNEELNLPDRMLPPLINLSESFYLIGQLDSAEFFTGRCLTISKELNHTYGIAMSQMSLSEIYNRQGDYDMALTAATVGIQLFDQFGDDQNATKLKLINTKTHFLNGNFDLALARINEMKLPVGNKNKREYYKLRSEIYAERKDYRNAFIDFKAFKDSEDSLRNDQNRKEIARLKEAFESNQKDNKIAMLENEKTIQALQLHNRNLWLYGLLIGGFLLLAVVYAFYHQYKVRQQQRILDIQQKLLRIQLNPHFLFNSLNAIQNMIYENKSVGETADMVGYFSKLMRNILDLNSKEIVTLQDEVKIIEQYLMIQNIRFDDPFDYTIEIADDIEPHEVGLPPMITQPFIENAIEHGIMSKKGEGSLLISFSLADHNLEISIRDNGIGREKASFLKKTIPHRSLATSITQKRLELLGQKWQSKTEMIIDDILEGTLVKGTIVKFKLPLIKV